MSYETRNKAPGKAFREGLSLRGFFKRFPDDKAAEEWFIKQRWPEEVCCVHCGSTNVQTGAKHPSMPYRCRDCGKRFSVRVGTVMQSSKLGYQTWLLATYLLTTSLKSVSSMKLHRDLDVTQKTAWHLAHRIRKGLNLTGMALFSGPVEADEAYLGGKRKHMPKAKRAKLEGRGAVGKTAVAAVKDRPSNQVSARVVPDTKSETLFRFVLEHVGEDAKIYTDDSTSYGRLVHHETVRHSLQEYVKGNCHTNGAESFWSMLKRSYHGTFHHFSEQHSDRYVGEFAARHNLRRMDTLDQMALVADRMVGKRLRYKDLVG